MRKLTVPNDFFTNAAEALKQGHTVKLLIGGQSMYPFIRGGIDVVEIIPCPPEGELPAWCCPFFCWEGRYMIHRYIGRESREGSEISEGDEGSEINKDDNYLMLGDGNVARIERVKRKDIIGLLRTIHRPDGTTQDCLDVRWLKKAEWWYRLRYIRRWLLPFIKMIQVG